MTAPEQNADRQQPVGNDFFQGDVIEGLERMRKRLLDLTLRNRLLNFRYTKKSSLRVVDELPDKLFARLVDGKEMLFRPVPIPRKTWSDDNRQGSTRSERPAVKDYAEKLGLATSFDLPLDNGAQAAAHHTDKEIRTLHYPEELEGILRSLNASARLAIEESGTNMLFLVFGYLEWFESPDSTDAHLAPLILLPVTLTREDADPQTRTFSYAIRYSGEEIVGNVSLQEKLRQDFGLALPTLGEETAPE
jgi:hypothetical protein